ncbi:Uncharacterised protein [Bordetella pertussis]|nr:Uncharacterised protein [Bordetella pertussis]
MHIAIAHAGRLAQRPGRIWSGLTCPDEQSIMSAPAALKWRAISTASSAVMPPSTQSCAEIRTDMGSSAGQAWRTARNTSSG